MNLPNPDIKFANSKGIDLPILTIYMAGKICGEHIDKCLNWQHTIVNIYRNYNGKGAYPVAFLSALNSKESDSVDKLGLTSALDPSLIFLKDLLSIQKADALIANMNDYLEEGIEDLLKVKPSDFNCAFEAAQFYQDNFYKLQKRIINHRSNWGTLLEIGFAMYMQKPIILIAANKRQEEMLKKHPFLKRNTIVGSVEELLEKKIINILYKAISGAIYE